MQPNRPITVQQIRIVSFVLLIIVNTGLSVHANEPTTWFSPDQAQAGEALFRQHCAGCHGTKGESTPNWRQADSNGYYPPPPLNGSAHTWHHDLPLLRKTIREGGQKLGGLMPPFENLLSSSQIDQVIAFFQSLWPDDIYQKWAQRFDIPAISNASTASTSHSSSTPNMEYLEKRLGNNRVGKARMTRMPGIYHIQFGDKNLYLSEDGAFAFIGDMIDLKNGINLSKPKKQ